MIAGLLHPEKGEIIFKGKRINHLKSWKRSRLGIIYVPEGRRIFSKLTVKENLLMSRCYQKEKRKNAHQLLKSVYELFPILK